LLFVVRCLLFVVCCLLFVVRCSHLRTIAPSHYRIFVPSIQKHGRAFLPACYRTLVLSLLLISSWLISHLFFSSSLISHRFFPHLYPPG
jgi:hypothetical protein